MHSVRFVREDALPSGHCWAMVRTEDDSYVLFVKRGAVCAVTLEQAWGAFLHLSQAFRRAA